MPRLQFHRLALDAALFVAILGGGCTKSERHSEKEGRELVVIQPTSSDTRPRTLGPSASVLVCSSNSQRTVTLYDTYNGKQIGEFRTAGKDYESRLQFSGTGHRLLYINSETLRIDSREGGGQVECIVWDIPSRSERFRRAGLAMGTMVTMSPDGQLLALVQPSTPHYQRWKRRPIEPVLVIDLESGETRTSIETGLTQRGGIPHYLGFSPNGMLIVGGEKAGDNSAIQGRALVAFSVEERQRQLTAECDLVHALSSEVTNFLIFVGELDRVTRFCVVDLSDAGRTHNLKVTVQPPSSTGSSRASISDDGRYIACLARAQVVVVYDLRRGGAGIELGGHSAKIEAVAMSPDGTRVITSSNGATGASRRTKRTFINPIITSVPAPAELFVWSTATGQKLLTLEAATGPIEGVSFSPDGKQVLTEGMQTIVWDAMSGNVISTGGVQLTANREGGRYTTTISRDFTERIDLTVRYEPSTVIRIRRTEL